MKPTKLVPMLTVLGLALTSLACPTRPASKDADDATSGSGGAGDASGTAGSGSSGASGVAGAGSGGVSGASGAAGAGGGGVSGASGAAGATSGGPGGASGGAGSDAGVAGTAGGAGSLPPGYVVCGSVSSCPLASGGQCCYSSMDQSSTCQGAGATCDPVATGSGTYYIKTTIACDSSNDCPSNQICCYRSIYIGSETACMAASACVDAPPPSPGGYSTTRRQVCDPTKIAPSECLAGTCKTATTLSQSLPSYLNLCL
jgi:hypothetical protein